MLIRIAETTTLTCHRRGQAMIYSKPTGRALYKTGTRIQYRRLGPWLLLELTALIRVQHFETELQVAKLPFHNKKGRFGLITDFDGFRVQAKRLQRLGQEDQ
ncbi:hypothetical protein BaRGS_00004024 [Batillaria attramentaria]|uniref:Uncharacterized protein n=1 Tax=Batillaria attramentaria TaxID=370345 RepID=A0ABD0M0F4_9CAEN